MQGLSPRQLLLAGLECAHLVSAWTVPQLAGRGVGGGVPPVRHGARVRFQLDVGNAGAVCCGQLCRGGQRVLCPVRGGHLSAV